MSFFMKAKGLIAAILTIFLLPFAKLPATPRIEVGPPTANIEEPYDENYVEDEDFEEDELGATTQGTDEAQHNATQTATEDIKPEAPAPAAEPEDDEYTREAGLVEAEQYAPVAEWDVSDTDEDDVKMYYYEENDEDFIEAIKGAVVNLFVPMTAYAATVNDEDYKKNGTIVIDGEGATDDLLFFRWIKDKDKYIDDYNEYLSVDHGIGDYAVHSWAVKDEIDEYGNYGTRDTYEDALWNIAYEKGYIDDDANISEEVYNYLREHLRADLFERTVFQTEDGYYVDYDGCRAQGDRPSSYEEAEIDNLILEMAKPYMFDYYIPVCFRDFMWQAEDYWNDYMEYNPSTIIINGDVTEIGWGAFLQCENVETVIFNANVQKINTGAFAQTNIRTITLPQSLTMLGNQVFTGCENLKDIYVYSEFFTMVENAFKYISNRITNVHFKSIYAYNAAANIPVPFMLTPDEEEEDPEPESITVENTTFNFNPAAFDALN